MSYWFWQVCGRMYWKKLNTHYTDKDGKRWYAEWKQRRYEIKDSYYYVQRARFPRQLHISPGV